MSCVRSPWRWDLSEFKLLGSHNLLCNFSILWKKKRGWGVVKGEQTIDVRSVSLSFTLCSRDPLVKILIINYWCVCPALSGGGHRRGEGGWDFPMWPHPALLQPPRWDLLRHHHQPGRGVQSQGARTSAWYFHSIYFQFDDKFSIFDPKTGKPYDSVGL